MPNKTEGRIPLADLLVFHQLARSLTSSFDLDTILRTILEHMERMVEAELWALLMLDENTKISITRSPRARNRKPCAGFESRRARALPDGCYSTARHSSCPRRKTIHARGNPALQALAP